MGPGGESLDALRAAARSRLDAAAAALRAALPDLGPPTLAACGCPVCLHPDNRRAIETGPRDAIPLPALSDYLQSVEAGDLSDHEADYLTPVIFDALAAGLEPHPFGDHLAFWRHARSGRPARWPAPTRAGVTEAFCALAAAAPVHAWLETTPFNHRPGRFYSMAVGALLAAAEDAGADLDAVMETLDALPTDVLARTITTWVGGIDYGDGGVWRLDPRVDRETPLGDRLSAWLGRETLLRRLETAFFDADSRGDPAAAALSEAHWLLVCQYGSPSDPAPADPLAPSQERPTDNPEAADE